MSSEDTMRVLERHAAAAQSNDVSAIMRDYHEGSVLISSRHGVLKGSEIRRFFEEPADLTGFEVISYFVHDDGVLLTWRTYDVPFGSDTFVIRDGKIAIQTVAFPPE